jgi:hypothetical protein
MHLELGWRRAGLVGLVLLGFGCGKKTPPAGGAARTASAAATFQPAAPVASGLPAPVEDVSRTVNPRNLPVYSGPTGNVAGVVTAVGDLAPPTPEHLAKIKGDCPEARQAYSHLFREGMMRNLADVLVAVTGYSGYLPATEPKQTVAARGCAFSTQTVALTFGQALDVVSKDSEAYVPNLIGAKMTAQLLALPGGAPSTLYPPAPGHYLLTDDIKVFMVADVFVVSYPTHAVTGLDGRYQIKGIPVGKARISALLPSTHAVIEKDIEIKAGETLEVPLSLSRAPGICRPVRVGAPVSDSPGLKVARSARAWQRRRPRGVRVSPPAG